MENCIDCANKSDEEIVALTLKNQDYYAVLMERYENKLAGYIRRISGLGKEDVEDILQNIFIKIYQNLQGFDQMLKFSSWAYRIAHNEIISHWRKSQVRPQLVGGEEANQFLHNIASELDIAKEMENKGLQADIETVLEKIDLKYREVLMLRFLEEKKYEEISDILRKPLGTVATLVNRAKKQFKKEAEKMKIKF